MRRGRLYIGTSGFCYSGWRGRFYPAGLPANQMLAYYARHLHGVELNNSFYRFPREGLVQSWVGATPPEFRFALKAQRSLTYSGAGFDRVGAAADFGRRVGWFEGRAGPVLLQLPPARTMDLELLEGLLSALGVRAAVEFRHPSWFAEEVYEVVAAHGGGVVVTDDEEWPAAPAGTAGLSLGYYRLRREYSETELAGWAERIGEDLDQGCDEVHAYFKHEAEGPGLAVRLQEMVGHTGSQ